MEPSRRHLGYAALLPVLVAFMACSGDSGAGPEDLGEPRAIIEGRILLEGEGG